MSALFLTKVEIDHETAYKAGLRDSYAWHQRVWQMFPGRDGEARDFLTRLDGVDGGLRLLVISAQQAARPDWCPEPAWQSKAVPDTFFEREAFRFSLIANPTRKVKSDKNAKNGRRVPITNREDHVAEEKTQPGLLSWLRRKGEQHGFTFEDNQVRTLPRPRQWFLKKGASGVHSATEFIGLIRVTDPVKFRTAVTGGIGAAKAFGFGMLCLDPT